MKSHITTSKASPACVSWVLVWTAVCDSSRSFWRHSRSRRIGRIPPWTRPAPTGSCQGRPGVSRSTLRNYQGRTADTVTRDAHWPPEEGGLWHFLPCGVGQEPHRVLLHRLLRKSLHGLGVLPSYKGLAHGGLLVDRHELHHSFQPRLWGRKETVHHGWKRQKRMTMIYTFCSHQKGNILIVITIYKEVNCTKRIEECSAKFLVRGLFYN